jgi:hypothetical protein
MRQPYGLLAWFEPAYFELAPWARNYALRTGGARERESAVQTGSTCGDAVEMILE